MITIPSLTAALIIHHFISNTPISTSDLAERIRWLVNETEARGFQIDLYEDMASDAFVQRALKPMGPSAIVEHGQVCC